MSEEKKTKTGRISKELLRGQKCLNIIKNKVVF